MFKRACRLNTSQFKEVFNFGKTIRTPHFLIKTKDNSLPTSRFAVVVSKKIAKKAVERNYLTRKVTHALQEHATHLPKKDYIFILNSSVKDLQYKDLLTSLQSLNI